MREYTVFAGSYRGIQWSAHRSPVGESMKEFMRRDFDWTHYIHLNLDQIPEEKREQFWLKPSQRELSVSKRKYVSYDYFDSIVSSLEWHGGCTFYEKTSGIDGDPRFVKIGCDYQHLWDEGREYSINYVITEIKKTINSLYDLIPDIGVLCWHGYCGKPYHKESEGIYSDEKKSSFICFSCEGKRQKDILERESVSKSCASASSQTPTTTWQRFTTPAPTGLWDLFFTPMEKM